MSAGRIFQNHRRGKGLDHDPDRAIGSVSTDIKAAEALFARCPVAHETQLLTKDDLASRFGISALHLKDERTRMGLGSFKALGASYAIARYAADASDTHDDIATALSGRTFICASAGNHGLSMAAGARLFGANAVVYLAETVPDAFVKSLEDKGAGVVRFGNNYEASMAEARRVAAQNDWTLLSDSSWKDYVDVPRLVMEGYLIIGGEISRQIDQPPTHIFLQAGVGGLAVGGAVAARHFWGDDVTIVVVEPEFAPALIESVEAGEVVDTGGPVSTMGRLDCKTPSHLAIDYLAREADYFMTVSDELVAETVSLLDELNLTTTPSGGAGIAAIHHHEKLAGNLNLDSASRAVVIVSETL